MKLSIVTTLYCSAKYIEEFYSRTTKVAQGIADTDYEIIMVNDGSPDNSLEIAEKIARQDEHLTILDFSRNFGHHRALMAGLEHSTGDFVFLIDIDLEEEPEWLIPFSEEMKKSQCDVVYGVQKKRRGAFFERWTGAIYYKLINWLTDLKHQENQVTARLMTRDFVNALIQHQERAIIFTFLCAITGFRQIPIYITKKSTSPTTYTLKRKINLVIDSITSFSDKPLKIFFNIGLIITSVSFLYIVYLLFLKLCRDIAVDGYTSIMISIWFIGGIIISQIGVIGMYLSKIFIETKSRPPYIIRKIINKNKK
ncbi:MAG: glycosyltransferase family 2 protein [Desulfovibrionaceae bacterium]|nr:glycosyltransferase family 2 protein [Desulfovibrionaceae bacterium]